MNTEQAMAAAHKSLKKITKSKESINAYFNGMMYCSKCKVERYHRYSPAKKVGDSNYICTCCNKRNK